MTRRVEPEALRRLCAYDWPGNVRELRNVIERVLVLHGRDRELRVAALPEEFQSASPAPVATPSAPADALATPPSAPRTLDDAVADCERRLIADALCQAHGVQTHAAEILGTTRRILKYKMEKLGIRGDDTTPPDGTP